MSVGGFVIPLLAMLLSGVGVATVGPSVSQRAYPALTLVVPFTSIHLIAPIARRSWNADNLGIGFELRADSRSSLYATGGTYDNSFGLPSLYGGIGYSTRTSGRYYIGAGAEIGLMSGYSQFFPRVPELDGVNPYGALYANGGVDGLIGLKVYLLPFPGGVGAVGLALTLH